MECNIFASVRSAGVAPDKIRSVIFFILRRFRRPRGLVSVHLVGSARMREYNRRYRGRNRPTDVLAFPAGQAAGAGDDLGDIIICVPYIRRQAKEQGVSYEEECFRMLIHGLLHLLGFDHEQSAEARVMFSRQERLLRQALK